MSFLNYQQTNPEFLNNYLKYSRFISFGAKTTVDETFFDLRSFLRFLKYDKTSNFDLDEFKNINIKDISINDIKKVNQDTITDFLYFAKYDLNNVSKTRNRKLASIKKFFKYLEINNIVACNPTRNIQSAKVEKRNPKYLTLDESKSLLSKTIQTDNPYKIRNYAIICLFLNTGIRLSELINIDISNIKFDEKSIIITGKGDKQRLIYMDNAVIEAIKKYLEIRPKLNISNKDKDALFLSRRNKRISQRSIQTIVINCYENAFKDTKNNKLDELHTHSLRHSSATMMYNEESSNIVVIKRILGHESLSATEVYTHVSDKKLKEIMMNCAISSILERKENEKY